MDTTGIQNVRSTLTANQYQSNSAHPNRQDVPTADESQGLLVRDQVTLSSRSDTVLSYDGNMTLQGFKNDGFDLLRGLVLNIFKEQGLSLKMLAESGTGEPQEISLEEITPEKAAELVAEDGYFGVEQTSDRIANFAISIADGDPSRIDAIKEGINQGFNDALKAFGGWLPDISYNTYDAVMEKLDAWVDEGKAVNT